MPCPEGRRELAGDGQHVATGNAMLLAISARAVEEVGRDDVPAIRSSNSMSICGGLSEYNFWLLP
jgi:hypothetical protein